VSQAEIAHLLANRNRLRQLKELVESHEASIKARLEAGAPVQPGDHIARLEERFRANVPWKQKAVDLAVRLGLNGEAWAQNVLTHTAKARTVQLVAA